MKKHLEFTLVSSCAVNCGFCPQLELKEKYLSPEKFMSPQNFIEILSKVPSDVEIHFSGFAEPFLHPSAGWFMYVARLFKRRVFLYTTLIGFKEATVQLLKHAKPDLIRIHVPDTKGMIYDSDKWIEFHEAFLKTGLTASYMAMGELAEPIAKRFANRPIEFPAMLSRAGNLWKPKKIEGRLTCGMERWHSNVVMPNGDVYLCCMDYGLTCKLGNLLTMDYETIRVEAAKYEAEKNPCGESICRQCEWARPL